MDSRDHHRLAGVQLLRAGAAVMVLIGHVLAEAEHYFGVDLPGDAIPWTRGVDIFFVISGFVITLSIQRFHGQPLAFLSRRFLRVVPMYWTFTTMMVAAVLLVPGGTKETTFDPVQIISSYGFIPYERADGRIAPVLSLGWTLNYELFFYGLAACCLMVRRTLASLSLIIIGIAVMGRVADFENTPLRFWSDPIMLEFVAGIVLAKLWLAGYHFPRWDAALVGLILGFALLIVLDDPAIPRWLAAGGPATLIVASGTLLCPDRHLPGMIWGDASYALYLSHRFALRGATLVVVPMLPATISGAAVYVIATCALSLSFGLAIHLWFERPMTRHLQRRRRLVPA